VRPAKARGRPLGLAFESGRPLEHGRAFTPVFERGLATVISNEVVGEPRQVPDYARRQLAEQRQELITHARAQKAAIFVRRIERKRHAVALEVGPDVGSARQQKRPNERPRPGRQAGKTPGPRATQQAQEHRLGPIVGVVSGGDQRGADLGRSLGERLSPRLASPRLQIAARLERDGASAERYAEPFGERRRPFELGPGPGSQPVVDAMGHEPTTELAPQA
jgi:hypothetical protein